MNALAEIPWSTYISLACKIGVAWGLLQFVSVFLREAGADLAKAFVRERRARRHAKTWAIRLESSRRVIDEQDATGK